MSLDALAAASSERLQAETVGNSYEDNMAFKLMADRIENKKSWTSKLTAEERQEMRQRIKQSYRHQIADGDFERLLTLCTNMEESMLLDAAPSRLDYFKSGVGLAQILQQQQEMMNSGDGGKDAPLRSGSASASMP